MYVDDASIWWSTLALCIYFTERASSFSLGYMQGENKLTAGVIWTHLRAVIWPFIAAASWYVMAAESISLNNCVSEFGCFTSPAWASTTTVTINQFGPILYLLFLGLFFAFMVIGLVLAVYFAIRPLEASMKGEVE